MHAALRPCVTAGAALVGASVIAVTPIAAPPPDISVANVPVRLAASSIANIPVNLAIDIINIPANEIYAQQQWAIALAAGGSWWLKTPTNVWGWDPGNPPMLEAALDVLVPFPAISGDGGVPASCGDRCPPGNSAGTSYLGGSAPPGTLGYGLNVLAAAEAPMNANCGFTCADVSGEFGSYFQVPLSALMSGYTFPTVIDANQPGYPVAWSGQAAGPIDLLAPFTNFVNSLMADPSTNPIQIVSLQDIIRTNEMLDNANNVAFNPWFQGNFFFSGIPYLWGAPILIDGLINAKINPANCDPTCGPLPTSVSATTIPALIPVATFLNALAGLTTSPTLLTQLLGGGATSSATVSNLLAGATTSPTTLTNVLSQLLGSVTTSPRTISTSALPSVLPNMFANTVTVTTDQAPRAPSPTAATGLGRANKVASFKGQAADPAHAAAASELPATGKGQKVVDAATTSAGGLAAVLGAVQASAPDAPGLKKAIGASAPPITAPSTNVTRGANKVEPGELAGVSGLR
jgi:hypothetical protein